MTENRLLTIVDQGGGRKGSFAVLLLCVQLAAAVVAIIAVNLAPPVSGRMLVLPLWPGARADVSRIIAIGGGRLVGAGPVAGSLIVDADSDRLRTALVGSANILINARGGGCG